LYYYYIQIKYFSFKNILFGYINKEQRITKNKMQTKVIKLEQFDANNVKFSFPRANKYGGKIVYINYDYQDGNEPKPLRIQLPKMKAPFGISGWDKDRSDKSDTSPTEQSNDTLELSVSNNNVVEKLELLDKIIIEQAVKNSKDYFKKKYDSVYIKNIFKSALKFNENEDGERDNKYPPRLKTKIYKDGEHNYKMQIFDSKKQPLKMNVYNHLEIIPKGSECLPLLECAGIWIINDKFGVSWKPAQMIVYKSDNQLKEFAFLEDEDIDNENTDEIDNENTNEIENVIESVRDLSYDITKDPLEDDDPLEKVEKTSKKSTKSTKTK